MRASSGKKNLYSLLILAALVAVYLLFFKQDTPAPSGKRQSSVTRSRYDKREADFRHNRIYYTKHGKCRMDCRHIDESEVKEILQEGEINYSKSDLKAKPCPKYAVEGVTHDGQKVRIIVGDCSSQASIVTVIDLENDFECECN